MASWGSCPEAVPRCNQRAQPRKTPGRPPRRALEIPNGSFLLTHFSNRRLEPRACGVDARVDAPVAAGEDGSADLPRGHRRDAQATAERLEDRTPAVAQAGVVSSLPGNDHLQPRDAAGAGLVGDLAGPATA